MKMFDLIIMILWKLLIIIAEFFGIGIVILLGLLLIVFFLGTIIDIGDRYNKFRKDLQKK